MIATAVILILIIWGISYIYYWFYPKTNPNNKRVIDAKKNEQKRAKEKEQIVPETKNNHNLAGNQKSSQKQTEIPIYTKYRATFALTENPIITRNLGLQKMYSADGEKLLSTDKGREGNNITLDLNPKPGTKIICDMAYDDFNNRFAKDILIPNSVIAIGYNAFMFLGAYNIVIPSSVRYITGNPFGKPFGFYNKAYCDTPYFKIANEELFSSDMTLYVANIKNETKIIKIPNGIKIVGRGAINGHDELELVRIPKSVIALAEKAISTCKNLAAIVFDGKISIIEPTALYGCEQLKVVYVPVGEKEYYQNILPIELVDIVTELSQTDIDEEKLLSNIFIFEDKKKAVANELNIEIRHKISKEDLEFIEKIKNDYVLSCVTTEEWDEIVIDWGKHEKEEHAKWDIGEASYSRDGKKFLSFANNLKEYSVKDGVEIVCDEAFNSIRDDKRIIMPNSVKIIGNFVFLNTNLKKFIIPQSVKKITGNPFVNCEGNLICESPEFCFENDVLYDKNKTIVLSVLNNENRDVPMVLPLTIKIIGRYSFYYLYFIRGTLILPQSVIYIGESAFGHMGINEIKLNEEITEIGKSAFSWSNIKRMELPDSVVKLGESAFEYCESLEYIKLSESLQEIEEKAFNNCKKLNHVYIPKGVKIIKKDAFYFCENLTEIYLPNSLERIEEGAFTLCGFKTVVVPKHTIIADGAFMENCKVIRRE